MLQYKSDGFLLHKSSEDAKKQQELERLEADAKAAFEAELKKPKEDWDGEEFEESKQLRNQFNFIERAIHTYNNPMKERGTVTEPPPAEYAERHGEPGDHLRCLHGGPGAPAPAP